MATNIKCTKPPDTRPSSPFVLLALLSLDNYGKVRSGKEIGMNENKKQAIVDKLTYIITHTSDLASFSIAPPPKYGMGTSSSPIRLIGDAAKQYEAVSGMLQNEVVWRDKFSKAWFKMSLNQCDK